VFYTGDFDWNGRTYRGSQDKTLTATLRQPFDLLALTNTTWQRKKAGGTL